MEKLLVSACLLDRPCRYDGTSNVDKRVQALAKYYELIPICPECDGGLSTPRIPSECQGSSVINQEGQDVTQAFVKGANHALEIAKEHHIRKAILKAHSPSCGSHYIYDGSFSHTLTEGDGVTTKLLREHDLEIYDEESCQILLTNAKKRLWTRRIAISGVLTALTILVSTFLIIPLPQQSGFLNLSDLFILVGSCMVDPISGALIGLLGATTADLLAGFAIYAPFTAVIKATEGLIAGLFWKRTKGWIRYLGLAISGIIMALLYLLTDTILFDFPLALANLPFNLLQGMVAAILASIFLPLWKRRTKLMK